MYYSPSSGILINNSLEFNSQTVATTFPINMDPEEALPTEDHPFDVDQPDDNKQFISTIIQALLGAALVKDTTYAETVLKEVHLHWSDIRE